MVQVVVNDLSEIEDDVAEPLPAESVTQDAHHEYENEDPESLKEDERRTCSEIRSLEWCFALLGVSFEKPTRWQLLYKRIATLVLLLCCGRVAYQMCRYVGLFMGTIASPSFRKIQKTSTRVARLPLRILEYTAHIYLYYDLRKNEKLIGHLYRGVRGERFKRHPRALFVLIILAVASTLGTTMIKLIRLYIYSRNWSNYMWHLYIAMTPLRLLWSFSMIYYIVMAIDLIDQVANLSQRIRVSSPEGELDLVKICHRAFDEKADIRSRIQGINKVFSKMLLFQYGKILLYAINIFFYAIKKSGYGPLEMLHSSVSLVYFSTGIVLLSWAGTRLQVGMRDAVDAFVSHVLDREPQDMTMVGQIIAILNFDTPRDALTIWDSFILARTTVVTFLGGIVSFVAIVLQFDSEFMSAIRT